MKFETADKYATWGSTSWGGYFTGTDVLGALSFGFAEPTTGGDRSMSMMLVSDHDIVNRRGISGNVNFLAPLIKKASELDGRLHIDFKFIIDELYKPIDAVGFEKYQKSKRSWLIDDLENGITLEVVEREGRFYPGVEIHVYSSV
ncbi:hypothetical protein AAVH_19354 [Aphelenchoides avenae]|nr:hypothetical protein AAVH_19354 [Aphelenchus avenae]